MKIHISTVTKVITEPCPLCLTHSRDCGFCKNTRQVHYINDRKYLDEAIENYYSVRRKKLREKSFIEFVESEDNKLYDGTNNHSHNELIEFWREDYLK